MDSNFLLKINNKGENNNTLNGQEKNLGTKLSQRNINNCVYKINKTHVSCQVGIVKSRKIFKKIYKS